MSTINAADWVAAIAGTVAALTGLTAMTFSYLQHRQKRAETLDQQLSVQTRRGPESTLRVTVAWKAIDLNEGIEAVIRCVDPTSGLIGQQAPIAHEEGVIRMPAPMPRLRLTDPAREKIYPCPIRGPPTGWR